MELKSHVEHNEPNKHNVSSHQVPTVQVIDFHALKLQNGAMVTGSSYEKTRMVKVKMRSGVGLVLLTTSFIRNTVKLLSKNMFSHIIRNLIRVLNK